MGIEDTIFRGLTFKQKEEDVVTEMFATLLKRYKWIRDAILKHITDCKIKDSVLSSITDEMVLTQQPYSCGVFDLEINNNDFFIIIENKVHRGTHLQKSQSSTYIDFLTNKNIENWFYIFISPENYIDEKLIESLVTSHKGYIFHKTWTDILNLLCNMNARNDNARIDDILQYIRATVDGCNLVDSFSLEEKDLLCDTKKMHSTFIELKEIFEKIKDVSISNYTGGNWDFDSNQFGMHLKHKETGKEPFFIGYSFNIPISYSKAILGFAIDNDLIDTVKAREISERCVYVASHVTYFELHDTEKNSNETISEALKDIYEKVKK